MSAIFPALPGELNARLIAYCRLTAEHPDDVLADALALHLDAVEDEAVEEQVARDLALIGLAALRGRSGRADGGEAAR